MKKLLVKKKGYHRRGYGRKGFTRDHKRIPATYVRPAYVQPARFYIKDVGAVGRGKKVIPTLKKGALGIHLKDSMNKLKPILMKKAMMEGEKKIAGRLRALSVLLKRTNPEYSKKAGKLSSWISGSFRNKTFVGYPSGYRRKLEKII